MSYFYVDSTIGTRTVGGGTTKQTGTFDALGAANLYATRTLAIADGAGSGDVIVCAVRHAESTSSVIKTQGPTSGDHLMTLVADNSNCDSYIKSTAANETGTSTSNDVQLPGKQTIQGLWVKSSDDIQLSDVGSQLIAEDSTFEVTGSDDKALFAQQDGCWVKLTNCTLKGITTSTPIQIHGGSRVEIIGGSVDSVTGQLTKAGFINGGGSLSAKGFDISVITGTIIKDVGSSEDIDDRIDVEFTNCPISASAPWTNEDFKGFDQRLKAVRCSDTSAKSEYAYYEQARGGVAEDQDDAGIHRSEVPAWPSGTKTSIHVLTNTDASVAAPFYFDIPSTYIALSVATTDVVRVYLACVTALDDSDVYVRALAPDFTNNEDLNRFTTKNSDPFTVASAGTALTTDSGSTWKNGASDLTAYNEYYIDIDTSGNRVVDCVPDLRVYVAIPSTAIYFDLIPDAVA